MSKVKVIPVGRQVKGSYTSQYGRQRALILDLDVLLGERAPGYVPATCIDCELARGAGR